jgi:hypothetical protein
MSKVNGATPQALIDLYNILSREDRQAFLGLMGEVSTAEDLFQVARHLTPSNLLRFNEIVIKSIVSHQLPLILPLVTSLAVEAIKESPGQTQEQLQAQVSALAAKRLARLDEDAAIRAHVMIKEKRDRKSDPDTVRRNVEICNRKLEDPGLWSNKKLAREYRITPRAIGMILADEPRWRRLAAEEEYARESEKKGSN